MGFMAALVFAFAAWGLVGFTLDGPGLGAAAGFVGALVVFFTVLGAVAGFVGIFLTGFDAVMLFAGWGAFFTGAAEGFDFDVGVDATGFGAGFFTGVLAV